MTKFYALLAAALLVSGVAYAEDNIPLESRASEKAIKSDGPTFDPSLNSGYSGYAEQEAEINKDIEFGGLYTDKGGAAGRLGSESAGGLRGGVDLSIRRR